MFIEFIVLDFVIRVGSIVVSVIVKIFDVRNLGSGWGR